VMMMMMMMAIPILEFGDSKNRGLIKMIFFVTTVTCWSFEADNQSSRQNRRICVDEIISKVIVIFIKKRCNNVLRSN
jgi:hypothetical protein